MEFAQGITVTVERPGGTDRYGHELPSTSHLEAGCALAPAGSTEATEDAATLEWEHDLLAPYDADFRPEDLVVLNAVPQLEDDRYGVYGRPRQWRNPFTGWEAGLVVRLKGASG